MAMSPTNGADYLKCLGLDYLDSFRLLSLVTNEEIQSSRNGSGSPLKNPAVMIAGGSVLILIGGLGVLRGFSVHSNAVIIDHGITLCLGIFLCVWPLIKGARK